MQDQPATPGNPSIKLSTSFGPAMASAKNFWCLKPGEVRDAILQKREEAIASIIRLQEIADSSGLTLKEHSGQYLFSAATEKDVPDGWRSTVIRSGSPREYLPQDQALYAEIDALREKASWRPVRDVESAMASHVKALLDPSHVMTNERQQDYAMAACAKDKIVVELVGDDVYIQTLAHNSAAFPDWERRTASEYYAAVSRFLEQTGQPTGPVQVLQPA